MTPAAFAAAVARIARVHGVPESTIRKCRASLIAATLGAMRETRKS